MGQYHKPFNLDKKQYLDPHKLGDGLKLLEQLGWSPGGTNDALHMLLPCSNGRGGGDFQSESSLIGSWSGDRIAIIGDYAKPGDLEGVNAEEVYNSEEYEDITDALIPIMEQEYELVYVGTGWKDRVQFSRIEGHESSYGIGDRHICINGKEYLSSDVVKALKAAFSNGARVPETIPVSMLTACGLEPVE